MVLGSVRPPLWYGAQDGLRPTSSSQWAWTQFGAACAALGGLAWLLPGPGSTVRALCTGYLARTASVADTAMLSVATLAVWSMLAWAGLITCAALTSRVPGTFGKVAQTGLSHLAPVAVRQVLLTVVGASMVTGLAACGAPSADGSGAAAVQSVDPPVRPAVVVVHAAPKTRDRIAVEGSAARFGAPWSCTSLASPVSAGGSITPSAIAVPAAAAASAAAPFGVAGGRGPAVPVAASASAAAPFGVAGGRGPAVGVAAVHGPAVGLVRAAVDEPVSGPDSGPISVDWPTASRRAVADDVSSVVVLRGDSLWTIAARHLPVGTDDAHIDRAWRAWYSANTTVIGSDPNYILPGQILLPPNPGTGTR